MDHRGRHQAQGYDIPNGDQSKPWAQATEYAASVAHADLTMLADIIGGAARERREACFAMAHRFITNAQKAGGVGPTRRNFPAGPNHAPDVRVDIEVLKGLAFV